MADKLVTIMEFTDYIEAEMAKQLLDDYGIKGVLPKYIRINFRNSIKCIKIAQ